MTTLPGMRPTWQGWHWVDPESGSTAEQLDADGPESSTFYSHQYDEQGKEDVQRVAEDYILAHTEKGSYVQKFALYLLADGTPETDYYHRGGDERWYICAAEYIEKAKGLAADAGLE